MRKQAVFGATILVALSIVNAGDDDALAPGARPGTDASSQPAARKAAPIPRKASASQGARFAGEDGLLRGIAPKGFISVVQDFRDPKTGQCTLRANGAILQWELKLDSRQFKFLELWRFDPGAKRWDRLAEPGAKAVTITADKKRTTFGRFTDQVLITLTDKTGLYWARWLEDGKLVQMPVCCGPVMPQDYKVAPPPKGMVVAWIPYDNRAEVGYIPDPRKFFEDHPPAALAATRPTTASAAGSGS